MLDVRYSHLYFYQSLNRLQRGLSAIAELLVYRYAESFTSHVKIWNPAGLLSWLLRILFCGSFLFVRPLDVCRNAFSSAAELLAAADPKNKCAF